MIKTYIESTDPKFKIQLNGFCENYPTYASELNVLPSKITALNAGNAVVQVIFSQQEKMQTGGYTFTSFKNLVRNGNGSDVITAYPTLPVYPSVMPPLCDANVEELFKEVIQECVDSGNLSETIAKALGIFAEEVTDTMSSGTPNLTVKTVGGGHPQLHCTMGDYEAYEIWKDSGAGYSRYDVSTSPNYVDMATLPAVGTNVIWNYKVIYRYKNVQIGNWSVVVSIAVKGSL